MISLVQTVYNHQLFINDDLSLQEGGTVLSKGNLENTLRNKYEKIALHEFFPFSIHWDITAKCNFRCIHCCVKDRERDIQDLPMEVIIKTLKTLKKMGSYIVSFTGGEPLLYSDLKYILEEARNIGFEVHLLTNGLLLNEELILYCKKRNIHINVSLYGASDKTYDTVTGTNGNYCRVLRNIEELNCNKNSFDITINLLKQNAHEVNEIKKLCNKYNKKALFNIDIASTLKGCLDPISCRIDQEDIDTYNIDVDLVGRPQYEQNRKWDPICKVGRSVLSIRPNGDITPCYHYPIAIGNVTESDLPSIWESHCELNKLREIDSSSFTTCINCGINKWCDICMGKNIRENNDIAKHSDYICQATKWVCQVFCVNGIFVNLLEPGFQI